MFIMLMDFHILQSSILYSVLCLLYFYTISTYFSICLIDIFHESVFILPTRQEKYAQEVEPRLRIVYAIFQTIEFYSSEEGLDFLGRHRVLWVPKYRTFSVFHFDESPEITFFTDDI